MAVVPDTDVNLAGNIRDVLNAAGGSVTNEVITFFQTRANINKWAKYKPFKQPKAFNITDSDRGLGNYGLSNVPYWDNANYMADYVRNGSPLAGNCGTPYFAYIPPIGGTSEPLRLEDFRGYYTEAVQPYLPFKRTVVMAEYTNEFTISIPVNHELLPQHNIRLVDLSFVNSEGKVLKAWKDCYLCMGLLAVGGSEFYIATGNTSMSDNPTIGNYPDIGLFVFDKTKYIAGEYKAFLFVSNIKNIGSEGVSYLGLFSPITFAYGEVTLKNYVPPVELKDLASTRITSGRMMLTVSCKIYNNTDERLLANIEVILYKQNDVVMNTFNYEEYIDAHTFKSFGKSYLDSQVSDFYGAKKTKVTVVIGGRVLSETVDIFQAGPQ